MNGIIALAGMIVGGCVGWGAGTLWMLTFTDFENPMAGLIPIATGTVSGIVVGGVVASVVFT